ncbi:MAG: ATP-dependent DNA helicase RecQ, partial [Ferruginibacter sp.]
MSLIHKILKNYWGYDAFRPLQEDIIKSVLDGTDTLALLPTGGGKSLCFQVPALAMEGICLVISPLIALMKDQVQNLEAKGIPALAIHSGMNYSEVKKELQKASNGSYKFLYVSPERIETSLFKEYIYSLDICLIAIDEAHCISQWGFDFRPAYRKILNIRKELPQVPVIALTASATLAVQDDICLQLKFKNSLKFQQSFERPNLSYSVLMPPSRETKLTDIIKKVEGSAIVYCKSRRQTKQISDLIKMHGISSDYYHAGLTSDERNNKQERWIKNEARVIVCTNAFGMGIDKPDVRLVIHYDAPDSLENYYQEAGRAGRDGKKSYAVLLTTPQDKENLLNQLEVRFPSAQQIKKVYYSLMDYLQIPAGNGEGLSYDFDILTFSDNFKLNILDATYAIQALAKGGYLSYNEVTFKSSVLEFTLSKNELFEFEESNPLLEPLIKGLLRSYEGIFDRPVSIYESNLSWFIKWPVEKIKEGLLMLHNTGVVNYKPQSEKPTLYFLLNRMYHDDYYFDITAHNERKKHYAERLNMMINFWEEKINCRSTLIANYFNDKSNKRCGICDNCINAKKRYSKPQFIEITNLIISQLSIKSAFV